jgi:hypothetical protein
MTLQDNDNEPEYTHPVVTRTASFDRFQSAAEVLCYTTNPWVKGGRAYDIIKSSKNTAEAISASSANLIKQLSVAGALLGLEWDAPHEYERLCVKRNQETANSSTSTPEDRASEMISLLTRFAREMVDHVEAARAEPLEWVPKQDRDQDVDRLSFVMQSLDYTRWQILKEFAKLVIIFDDHDDPSSKEPCEAWNEDARGIDND